MELNKIYNEDCLEGMKKIEDNSVDLVVTSPPYFNARDYSNWETYEDYLLDMKNIFIEVFRITKENRMVAVNISPVIEPRKSRAHSSIRRQIPFDLYSIMKDIGFYMLEDIIWSKPNYTVKNRNGGFFRHRKPLAYKPNLTHEYILVFQKPSKHLIDKTLKDNKEKVDKSLVLGDYEKTSVWDIKPKKDKNHSAVFPLVIPDKIIQYYSFVDDTILDPFMGSGTTAISAINNNRNYIGFELDEGYCKISLDRIKECKEKRNEELL